MAEDRDTDGGTVVLTREKVKRPSMYTVIFLNDDYTPMEFVVRVMIDVFHLSVEEATHLMLKVHKEGKAAVGSFTFEVASHKAYLVMELAKQHEHPLQCFPEQV